MDADREGGFLHTHTRSKRRLISVKVDSDLANKAPGMRKVESDVVDITNSDLDDVLGDLQDMRIDTGSAPSNARKVSTIAPLKGFQTKRRGVGEEGVASGDRVSSSARRPRTLKSVHAHCFRGSQRGNRTDPLRSLFPQSRATGSLANMLDTDEALYREKTKSAEKLENGQRTLPHLESMGKSRHHWAAAKVPLVASSLGRDRVNTDEELDTTVEDEEEGEESG